MHDQFSRGRQGVAKRRLRGSEFLWLFLFALTLMIPMIWVASLRTDLVSYGYAVVELKSKESELLQERAYLRSELAHLARPERVFRELERQGLVPRQDQVLVYESDGTLVAEADLTEERR